ncbi:hypothetical protein [Burkholderia ubonensis]|uniref:hypothetical protein n=1 Tax=Burkholderia ubonensis TaxID=101571 RepID=UPI000AC6E563|nr:hypothetical protein [Burkholderia ubonensis]
MAQLAVVGTSAHAGLIGQKGENVANPCGGPDRGQKNARGTRASFALRNLKNKLDD